MIFQAPAILRVGAPTADGGIRLRFATNQLSDEDKLKALKFDNKFGYVLFKENEYQAPEIPKGNAEDSKLSPSVRLRNVLYVRWQQMGKPGTSFDAWYPEEMNKIIDKIKATLDDTPA